MNKTWLTTVAVAAVFLSNGVQAAGDAKAGEGKTAVCVACHGPAGNSLVPTWPKLAGQHPEYLYKQLMDFKSTARVNESMSPQVLTLNEQDFADLAAYYASQTQTGGTTDPAAVELGGRIFRGGNADTGVPACTGCHGPAGGGKADWAATMTLPPTTLAPAIGSQHAAYVAAQLQAYRTKTRDNDMAHVMRDVAGRLSDDDIAAVAEYVTTLSR